MCDVVSLWRWSVCAWVQFLASGQYFYYCLNVKELSETSVTKSLCFLSPSCISKGFYKSATSYLYPREPRTRICLEFEYLTRFTFSIECTVSLVISMKSVSIFVWCCIHCVDFSNRLPGIFTLSDRIISAIIDQVSVSNSSAFEIHCKLHVDVKHWNPHQSWIQVLNPQYARLRLDTLLHIPALYSVEAHACGLSSNSSLASALRLATNLYLRPEGISPSTRCLFYFLFFKLDFKITF